MKLITEIKSISSVILKMKSDCKAKLKRRDCFNVLGFEVIHGFFDKSLCDRLIQLSNRYAIGRSYMISGNCYVVSRKELRETDQHVEQIMNVQDVDTEMQAFFNSRRIEQIFEERLGEKVRLLSVTLQIDDIDDKTKRGFHNDTLSPQSFKAFIYLNDVNSYGDGPYTVVPGSHRDFWKRSLNYLYNRMLSLTKIRAGMPASEMSLFYDDNKCVTFFGPAGTLIISNQCLAHKGWHEHNEKKRYVLICYLSRERDDAGKPFTLGKSMAQKSESLSLENTAR